MFRNVTLLRMELTAGQLAEMIQGVVEGDASVKINAYSKIEEAERGSLTFLANPKYTHYLYDTHASVVLVRNDFKAEHPVKATLIRVEDPYATLAYLLSLVSKATPAKKGIEQPSFIAEGVNIPESAYIGAFAYIGKGAKIGENAQIYPQSYVGDNVEIGAETILYAGVNVY